MVKSVVGRVKKGYEMAIRLPSKRFITVDEQSVFPTPDNVYQVCWYRFGPGQAFIVRGRLPKAEYFGLCLYNAWMESLDYTVRQVSLNQRELVTEPDGTFTIVIAPDDPGTPNWLDCGGHYAGYVIGRSLLLEGAPADLTSETVWSSQLPPRA
jgi:hypothetical protein